jgi:hypothetical protein
MMLIGDGTFVLPGCCSAGLSSPPTPRSTAVPTLGGAPFPTVRR